MLSGHLTGPWWYQPGLPTPCKTTKSRLSDAEITKGRRSLHHSSNSKRERKSSFKKDMTSSKDWFWFPLISYEAKDGKRKSATRKTRPGPDPGHEQQPLVNCPGQFSTPGISRRDQSQVVGNFHLQLDARGSPLASGTTREKERAAPELSQIRSRSKGAGLPPAKANPVRRGAERTKFGYRTGIGPISAPEHMWKPTDAAPSNGPIQGPNRARQPSPSKILEVWGKK